MNGNQVYQRIGKSKMTIDYMRSNLPKHVYGKRDTTAAAYSDLYYDYNNHDDRIYKKVQNSNGSSVSSYYLRDASGKELAELDMVNNSWIYYAYGRDRIAELEGSNGIVYYNYDHLGSVRVVYEPTSNCSGSAVLYKLDHMNDYYAFGKTLRNFGGDKHGYQGSEKNKELGDNDYYTHFRGLDVEIGRWKGVDPVYHAHESPYVSMGNNPVSFTDVLGDYINYGSDEQRQDIEYLRKHDKAYNKWWKENTRQYKHSKKHHLNVNVVAGRNDLKHSDIESARITDGKVTSNAYLNYDGTLDHREYGVVPTNQIRKKVEGTSSYGIQYSPFSFNLVATLPNFKRWEASVDESSIDVHRPSGSFRNANSRMTVYSGTMGATKEQDSYDQLGSREHKGYSEAYIIFREIGSPVYYNQTLTRDGWGFAREISLPDHRKIIKDK